MEESADLEKYKYYLYDLGFLLKEDALKAKEDRERYRDTKDNDYYMGQLHAYLRVISLMQQQAQGFMIPLEDLRLEDIEPDAQLI